MIAAWMIYTTVVAGLIGLSALALDRLARPHGRPLRWIWVGAMALGVLGPLLPRLLEWARSLVPVTSPAPAATVPMAFLEPLVVRVGNAGVADLLEPALIALWALATCFLLASWARATLRIRRMTRDGEERTTESGTVVVTGRAGPAVVGVLRTRILLPKWLAAGDRRELEIALLHEEEHAAARDTVLLAGSFAVVALLPWNPALWWIRGRLREAVEVDCDRRVLARRPELVRRYANTLVRLSGRTGGFHAAAALAEPPSLLERRIDAMTSSTPKHPWLRGTALSAAALLALVLACSAPEPGSDVTGPDAPPSAAVAGSDADPTGSESAAEPGDDGAIVEGGPEGVTRIDLGGDPVIYVDGVRVDRSVVFGRDGRLGDPGTDGTDDDALLDPADIESIEVIKGGAAERIYGSDAAGGVVQITTNRETGAAGADTREAGGQADASLGDRPTFTPFTVAPNLSNREVVRQALVQEYPPLLRDAGIGGTVIVWFFIDSTGEVARTLIRESSGHPALDQGAMRVAETMEFSPALNRDQRVPVWISLPITFTTS